MIWVGAAFAVAAIVEYVGKRGFLTLSGRIGQAALFDLRRRVYSHFQRLSIGFHERYTSGRMVCAAQHPTWTRSLSSWTVASTISCWPACRSSRPRRSCSCSTCRSHS